MFLGFCKRVFLFEALFWVFKGLLHLIWWICDLFIFVSPLTFTLQTLKLICGESWDLCEFIWLCILMRTHYAMFYMFHKLCMHMRDYYAMFYMFHKLCMLKRAYYVMFYMFHGLCMFMQVHLTMLCKFNGLCMLMQAHLTMLSKFNGLCMFTLPCYAYLISYACLCEFTMTWFASLTCMHVYYDMWSSPCMLCQVTFYTLIRYDEYVSEIMTLGGFG